MLLISLLISQAGGEGFKRLNIIQPQNELPFDHQYGRKNCQGFHKIS